MTCGMCYETKIWQVVIDLSIIFIPLDSFGRKPSGRFQKKLARRHSISLFRCCIEARVIFSKTCMVVPHSRNRLECSDTHWIRYRFADNITQIARDCPTAGNILIRPCHCLHPPSVNMDLP